MRGVPKATHVHAQETINKPDSDVSSCADANTIALADVGNHLQG